LAEGQHGAVVCRGEGDGSGAQVGDLFMSLIHTCELNGVNPFDYLTGTSEALLGRGAGFG
jgi:hypothetical protein